MLLRSIKLKHMCNTENTAVAEKHLPYSILFNFQFYLKFSVTEPLKCQNHIVSDSPQAKFKI